MQLLRPKATRIKTRVIIQKRQSAIRLAVFFEKGRGLSQHDIQQHHNGEADYDAHCGKIGLRVLISLTFNTIAPAAKDRAKGRIVST